MTSPTIQTPLDEALVALCKRLAELSPKLRSERDWPGEQISLCADSGIFRWFVPAEWGGLEWTVSDIMRAYIQLGASCLTTTFILTQFAGACRRIAGTDNLVLKKSLLPKLMTGESLATVGISHLTTSGQHRKEPALRAERIPGGYRLDGRAPWATGVAAADYVVVGATLDDGRQLLAAIPTDRPGIELPPPLEMIAMGSTQTGPVLFDDCRFDDSLLVGGPVEQVMRTGVGAGTGGVQTSALAVGLCKAAIGYLHAESSERPDLLGGATDALQRELDDLEVQTLAAADGEPTCSLEELRGKANNLALRATQAALAAAKGTGYIKGHPAGRWCCEALLFLVWSCPQPVVAATLCELAGIAD